ncbi:MAG: hypothetical protein HW403_331, partial [Dehalococcoidia bacterium]|nr:hypothetical protein [Dehalococcoidia bacterium]
IGYSEVARVGRSVPLCDSLKHHHHKAVPSSVLRLQVAVVVPPLHRVAMRGVIFGQGDWSELRMRWRCWSLSRRCRRRGLLRCNSDSGLGASPPAKAPDGTGYGEKSYCKCEKPVHGSVRTSIVSHCTSLASSDVSSRHLLGKKFPRWFSPSGVEAELLYVMMLHYSTAWVELHQTIRLRTTSSPMRRLQDASLSPRAG